MSRKWYLIIGLLLLCICFAYIAVTGRTCTIEINTENETAKSEDYDVVLSEKDIVELTDKQMQGGILKLTFESLNRGRTFVDIKGPDDFYGYYKLYSHRMHILTIDEYFGRTTGDRILQIAAIIFLALVLYGLISEYRSGMRANIYQHKNVNNLGMMIFFASLLAWHIINIFNNAGIVRILRATINYSSKLSYIILPIAFVVFLLVTLSNLVLIRKEGFSFKNTLGFVLGLAVCAGTLFPNILGEYLQRSTIVDVHNERGWALYVEMAVENVMLVLVTYLECILLATIIIAFRAAKRIPKFNKDYILVLGCMIRKDGTLTPLLKGRADKALEFARLQKESTGKDIVFVPAGGKGDDEVIAEASAIGRYLVQEGIPEDRMIIEDKSENTYQNFKNAAELIRQRDDSSEPEIAFATTNYHVFRSGILATQQGIKAEGIGSKTKSYFWINAFIREFIATIYNGLGTHIKVIFVLTMLVLIMVYMIRTSVVL